jgi:hypothetical protein
MRDRDKEIDGTDHHGRPRIASAIGWLSAAAAAIALAPGHAGAAVVSDTGWAQLKESASDSASTTIAGNDFAIGYAASFSIEGYNWDVAPDTVTVTCVSYTIDLGIVSITVQASACPVLPGIKLSQTTANLSTTYAGFPAIQHTTTIVWDVPDAGATARVTGFFQVPATLFSHAVDLFKLTGDAIGNTDSPSTVSADVFVLGAKIAHGLATLPVSKRLLEKCVTLFDVDATFTVLGIPITVGASSDGCLDIDASASFLKRTLHGSVTPGASVDVTASAGIGFDADVISAQAGVSGNVTLVDASLPVSFSAGVGSTAIRLSESASLTMTGLDGELDLFAEGCLLGGCVHGDLEIFDWTGLTFVDTTIFSASQTFPY